MATNIADDWYYSDGTQSGGPLAIGELAQHALAGLLRPPVLVWHPVLSSWVTALEAVNEVNTGLAAAVFEKIYAKEWHYAYMGKSLGPHSLIDIINRTKRPLTLGTLGRKEKRIDWNVPVWHPVRNAWEPAGVAVDFDIFRAASAVHFSQSAGSLADTVTDLAKNYPDRFFQEYRLKLPGVDIHSSFLDAVVSNLLERGITARRENALILINAAEHRRFGYFVEGELRFQFHGDGAVARIDGHIQLTAKRTRARASMARWSVATSTHEAIKAAADRFGTKDSVRCGSIEVPQSRARK